MKDVKRYIEVTTRKEGIHRYPEAATNPDLKDVSFLAHPHRHIFHIRLKVSVDHNNRDIEFIQLKRWLESQLTSDNFDFKSCEMLAEDIILMTNQKYPKVHHVEVGVSEDGENGAVLSATFPTSNPALSSGRSEDPYESKLATLVDSVTSDFKTMSIDTGRVTTGDMYINPTKSKDKSMFISSELEGAFAGLFTLFVSGDVPVVQIFSILSKNRVEQVSFGAKGLCEINLSTVLSVLEKFPDIHVTVETDEFKPNLAKFFSINPRLNLMYRLVDSNRSSLEGFEDLNSYVLRNAGSAVLSSSGSRIYIKIKHSLGVSIASLDSFKYSTFDSYGSGDFIPVQPLSETSS